MLDSYMSDDCLLSVFLPLNVAVQTVYDNFRQYVLTARRLAKRGICRRRVTVCVSVCLCVSYTSE